jgi:hypothetical protein
MWVKTNYRNIIEYFLKCDKSKKWHRKDMTDETKHKE